MTASLTLSLDALPAELLQRIASFGPCESALALSKANKRIRHACNDRQVFISILKNRNDCLGPEWFPRHLASDAPTSSWARCALADTKARSWSTQEMTDYNELRSSFLPWAPQLMAASRMILHTSQVCVC